MSRPHVVIAVANLPVERDRRVIRECRALEGAGYRVSVICPRGTRGLRVVPGTADTRILAYPQPFAGGGLLSFAVEFAWSFFWIALRLAQAVLFQRARAAQACNPPDVFWPLALAMRALGKPFVFDHHDLSPEVYESRGGNPTGAVHRVLRLLEWLSLRCASAVVSTNESYKQMAIDRGRVRPDRITVVRNGPAAGEITVRPVHKSDKHTIVYLGVLGAQDGVDAAVLAAAELRHVRSDWRMVIAGDGECLADLKALSTAQGLDDVVEFTGWLGPEEVDELLSRATVALQPDPPTPHAERSTMAKTVEYLGRGVPVVAVDLIETRRSAAEAAVYVPTGAPKELAAALDELLSDPERRATMSGLGRSRFVEELAWEHQASRYIALWDRLLARYGADKVPAPRPAPHDQVTTGRARAETS
ncbi:glycosyltransferase WbuB [Longispora fulva]|uniref:Glycosyltransferase involved in cell wall biosynthesis n=1 Tax=Longispora fulva TaxID=619741 RepID=A0A8J7GPG6_9ACTN|nr:glycosyltransferase family 4 protein [Longispora fulva]MBG6140873.1 glycosyltransferase involved in cell wall biosynthesis [Longispora fulva]GIG60861.1 glycosyltransferase WbuB [Longispora fulva]